MLCIFEPNVVCLIILCSTVQFYFLFCSTFLICCPHLKTQVANWKVLQKSSDVSNAKSLCRLAWQGSGKVRARVHEGFSFSLQGCKILVIRKNRVEGEISENMGLLFEVS